MMDLTKELGQRIDDYQINELLGRGGFAHVYHATCKKTGVEVAIKMIDKEQMRSAGLTSRVQQEVSIHCRLRHPSVVELLSFFEDDSNVYLVVEFCHGGEMQKYLESRKTLTEAEARHFLVQVAHGMQYLQNHNILHRDLTLSNLLLTQDLQVKISDFGLATQLRYANEKHTTMCGTPNYIPPEIATRSEHGLEVDLWSLGCMLFTFLTGSPPFHDAKIRNTLTKVVMSSFQIPSHLSAEARDLIGKLLQKNPKQRIRLTEVLSHPFMCRSVSLLNRVRKPVHNSFQGHRPSEPLNTTRLKATRIKSGKMMLSILDSGEVIIEFLKGEMIKSVFRVSSDGQWIVVYQPRTPWHPTQASGLPLDGTDDRFAFERLPQMLWKKYAIAARFVHLVRQKTVKIILYQGDSACFLMENGDVEVKFAAAAGYGLDSQKKIARLKDGTVKLNNQIVPASSVDVKDWQFLQTVAVKLSALEESICMVDSSPEMFPAIFGRRTNSNGDTSTRSNLTLATNFTSLVDRSPESVQSTKSYELHVDGLGVAKRLPSGEIVIEFYDRTKVAVEAPIPGKPNEFCFVDRQGIKTLYPEGSSIPAHVRQRLGHLPRVIDLLK